MVTVLTVLLVVSLFITLGILIAGLIIMARGGQQSNLFMRLRIIFQLITIALVVVLVILKTTG